MPGWLGKHPKHKLFMIQSILLESQTWGKLKIKGIKPTALNCVRHPFNLALFFPPWSLPGASRAASAWVLMPPCSASPALWGSLLSPPALGWATAMEFSSVHFSRGFSSCLWDLPCAEDEARLEMFPGLLRTVFSFWSLPELESQFTFTRNS